MKKKSKSPYIISFSLLTIVILAISLPFLLIKGRYNFSEFWSLFFDKIFNLEAFYLAFTHIIPKIPSTLIVTFISAVLGLLLGLLLALAKINQIPVINQIRAVFVSFIRGTPIYVQLILVYTGIPLILQAINLNYSTDYNVNIIPPLFYAVLAFSLNEAAYSSETIRAAIESVDQGQIEAAKSLGMTDFQVFMRVTLKEAAVVATAPLGNALIGLLKGTSLAFVVAFVEMTAIAQIIGGSSFRILESYAALAILYWLICILLEGFIRWIEKRLKIEMKEKTEVAI
ncbi:MAG: amino acid ABC transporter permease [Lactovum sp.]